MKKFLIIVLASTILLGCSSTPNNLTSSSCQQKDWQKTGEKLALEGKSIHRFDNYIKECGSSLPSTAKTEFIGGYITGIKAFCTYDSGFERGHTSRTKSDLSDVCPLEVRHQFIAGYNRGRAEHRTQMSDFDRIAEAQDRSNTNKPTTAPVGGNPNRSGF